MAATNEAFQDPSFSELDLSEFTEEEKVSILAVMHKATEFRRQETDKFRQPMEGQLSKWTNLMKGWQYRWFTLDPDSGMLDYYVEKEKMRQGPRGSVHLAGLCKISAHMGAVIAPSDEDSFTFSVNAANGDVFKLRASNAKERQHWITRLRSAAEYHTSSIAEAAPPLVHHTPAAVTSPTTLTQNLMARDHSTKADSTPSASTAAQFDERSFFKAPAIQFHHTPANVTDQLASIRGLLHAIDDLQSNMIDQLELSPSGGETIFPLDENALILKATAQSTLSSLHHCFTILQQGVARAQTADLPAGGNVEWLEPSNPHGVKSSSDRAHTRLHSVTPVLHKKSHHSEKNEKHPKEPAISCCESARQSASQKPEISGEIPDDNVWDLPEESENQSVEEHKSVILHLLSQLKLGMDLTKVVLPTFILEPRSLLEMYSDFFAHPDLFMQIPDGLTAEDRMMAVLEFYLTSFLAGRKGAVAKKPYNPILGETFHCSWDITDCCSDGLEREAVNHYHTSPAKEDGPGTIRFVAEQLSHHPPISGFYAECPSKNICFNASIWTKSKFYGMSIGVANYGEGLISLLQHDEEYTFTFPSAYCRSILTYPWVELGGKVNITCAKTGYNASVTFHTKPFYGGKLHRVTGEVKNVTSGRVICKVHGEWNGDIEFIYTSNQEEPRIVDTRSLKVYRKRTRHLTDQEESESRRLWQHVTTALRAKDIDAATTAKHSLEQKQRNEAKERSEAEEQWKTKLFHRHGDGWMYNYHLRHKQEQQANGGI